MITIHMGNQGETVTFFQEADNQAPQAEAEVRLEPGADGPPPHIHTRQAEVFHIISGRIIAKIDGQTRTAAAGDTFTVKPGQTHTFSNGSDTEPLIFRGTIEPALNFQWMLTEVAHSLNRHNGRPSPVEFGYIFYQLRDEYRLAGLPHKLQDLLFGFLSRLAVLLGRTKHITPKEESSQEGQTVTAHR